MSDRRKIKGMFLYDILSFFIMNFYKSKYFPAFVGLSVLFVGLLYFYYFEKTTGTSLVFSRFVMSALLFMFAFQSRTLSIYWNIGLFILGLIFLFWFVSNISFGFLIPAAFLGYMALFLIFESHAKKQKKMSQTD